MHAVYTGLGWSWCHHQRNISARDRYRDRLDWVWVWLIKLKTEQLEHFIFGAIENIQVNAAAVGDKSIFVSLAVSVA